MNWVQEPRASPLAQASSLGGYQDKVVESFFLKKGVETKRVAEGRLAGVWGGTFFQSGLERVGKTWKGEACNLRNVFWRYTL